MNDNRNNNNYEMNDRNKEENDWQPLENEPKTKKKKSDLKANNKCLIHVRDDLPKTETLSQFSSTSWQTVYTAATKRNDQNVLSKDSTEGMLSFYHRKCYQSYTHKKSLEKLQPIQNTPTRSSKRSKSSASLIADQTKCIICKSSKTARSGSGYETLEKCLTANGAKSLRENASLKGNERLMEEIAGKDISALIAYEMVYHRSCYKVFTKPTVVVSDKEDLELETQKTFISLFNDDLLVNKRVVWMKDIIKTYEAMRKHAMLPTKTVSSKEIKKLFVENIKNDLTFYNIPGRGEIIFAKTESGEILSKIPLTDTKKIDECASIIRKEILYLDSMLREWPASEDDVKNENVVIPSLLAKKVSQ